MDKKQQIELLNYGIDTKERAIEEFQHFLKSMREERNIRPIDMRYWTGMSRSTYYRLEACESYMTFPQYFLLKTIFAIIDANDSKYKPEFDSPRVLNNHYNE